MSDERSDEQQNREALVASDAMRRGIIVNLMTLEVGERVSLIDDAVGEVVDNPRDGSWIIVRYLESPSDPSRVGRDEPVFAADISGIVE